MSIFSVLGMLDFDQALFVFMSEGFLGPKKTPVEIAEAFRPEHDYSQDYIQNRLNKAAQLFEELGVNLDELRSKLYPDLDAIEIACGGCAKTVQIISPKCPNCNRHFTAAI